MTWFSEGVKSGVVAGGTVLADTGAMGEGSYGLNALILACSVAAVVRLEKRNAANSVTQFSQTFWLSALAPVTPGIVVQLGFFLESERLRVVLVTGLLAGDVQASIFLA